MAAKVYSPVELSTQVTPFASNANDLVDQAERAEIVDKEKFDTSVDFIKVCNSQLSRLEEMRKAIVGPLNDHVRWINAQFKPLRERIEQAKGVMESKALMWQKAERDRIEAEAEAEHKRQEEEALAAAQDAQERGDEKAADAILDVAATTPEPDKKPATGRGSLTGATGSISGRWIGRVVDVRAVCRAIADGEVPEDVIKGWYTSKLNRMATDHGKEGVVHGIEYSLDESLSVK